MNTFFYKISQAAGFIPLDLLINLTGQRVIFPFYHTVSDTELPHIKSLYKVRSVKEFEKDLDFFLKHYSPLHPKDFINSIKEKKSIKKNSFLLSFDDGLREFYDVVAPVLKRKGIPAICFLNSGFIDNKDLFFRYKASILIESLRKRDLPIQKEKDLKVWFQQKKLSFDHDFKSLLSINYPKRNLLDELAEILNVNFQNFLHQQKPYMSALQIKELIKEGFTFGAHSIDHPKYSDIKIREQIRQTKESLEGVESALGVKDRLFSFPFTDAGVSREFFDTVFNPENKIADVTFGTAGIKKDTCRGNIQRIPVENDSFSAREVIIGEYLYYSFKALLNKNIIRRS